MANLTTASSTLGQVTDALPPILGNQYWLAAFIYIACGLIVLWLWSTVTKRIAKPYGGMLWVTMLAILFTPIVVDGPYPQLAPAIIGVVFALLSSDSMRVVASIFPITLAMGVAFLFGFMFEQIKNRIE